MTRQRSRACTNVALALAIWPLSVACQPGSPPSYDAAGFDPARSPLVSATVASATRPPTSANDAATLDSSTVLTDAGPPNSGEDPGALPQTRDTPSIESEPFKRNAKVLFDAICADAPDTALPFFFPAKAYDQVKDIPEPNSDWKGRLVRAFKRDIHKLHRQLGKKCDDARYVGWKVPEKSVRWVKPNEELNKLGYYRVLHSQLRIESGGKEESLDVTSLISWRGEWYVVHLLGFK